MRLKTKASPARPVSGGSSLRTLRSLAAATALAAIMAVAAVPAAAAPSERGYELVGPPGAGSSSVRGIAAKPDGEAIYWRSPGGEQGEDPAPADGATGDVFLARRAQDGWHSTWLTPDPAGRPLAETSQGLPGMRADGFVFYSSWLWTAPPWLSTDPALYLGNGADPSALLSAAPGTAVQPGLDESQWTVSQDLTSTVFSTTAALDPADTDIEADIYVRRADTVALVSTQTDGTADNTFATPFLPLAASGTKDGTFGDSTLTYGSQSPTGFPVSQGASPVSADGESIVFSTTAPLDPTDTDTAADLYLWRDGQGVNLISDDERDDPGCPDVPGSTTDCTDAAAEVSFVGMSEDASILYLRTREGLIDDDTDGGNDIYEYRVAAPAGQRLTRATGDGTSNGLYPVSVTADGRLFFATADRVGVDPPAGVGVVLYRWDGTEIVSVSTLTDADVFQGPNLRAFGIVSPTPRERAVRATADGSALLFQTTAALDPGDTDSSADLYLWRAGQGVTLVSGTGASPVGVGSNNSGPVGFDGGRVITDDASRVFFISTDPLTGDAGYNGRPKLYEWREGSGLTLVSPAGGDVEVVNYVDNDATGTSVFFMTPDSLVPADTDGGAIDTYAARVGGGFPEPPPPPDPCSGEACQGPATTPPGPTVTGLISLLGDGNANSVRGGASVGVLRTKAVTGPAARLKVRVPGAGHISVTGSRVRQTGASVSKAGTYPVRITLNPGAKESLKRKKRLKVKARVSFQAKDGRKASKTVSITFKQPNATTKKGR